MLAHRAVMESRARQTNKSEARERLEKTMGGKSEARLEFRFNTAEGRIFDCYVESEADLNKWLDAMPHWTSNLVMGWLHKRKLCVVEILTVTAQVRAPTPVLATRCLILHAAGPSLRLGTRGTSSSTRRPISSPTISTSRHGTCRA